jgi:hypothetical protein
MRELEDISMFVVEGGRKGFKEMRTREGSDQREVIGDQGLWRRPSHEK